ncbi:MAG: T9SS type A sorting domain-containing protein [Bacteroidales bacterium]
MKKILLLTLVLGFAVSSFAQNRVTVPKHLRNKAEIMLPATAETMNHNDQAVIPANPKSPLLTPEEEVMGLTWYDLQSNTSMQNRIHLFDDGTIGGVFTFGNTPTAFPERGTGYNYFDGTNWGPMATERLEGDRTGWPAYAPWGENGELSLAHFSEGTYDGLVYSMRPDKGTGDWTFLEVFGPAGGWEGMLWPRMATGGVDHSVIHSIAITRPVANGGVIYEGIDGAVLYSRSSDSGISWDPDMELYDELSSDYFVAVSGDTYEIQARGDVVAFTVGDAWTDFVLMKSTNGGDDWEKTVIWENPYPLWTSGVTDTFYCADGAKHLTIDMDGKVHVAFGINRALSADGTAQSWFPLVDGLGYWNEDMPVFSNDVDALNPYDDAPYTELVEDYNYIGWAQDVNGNGEWDIIGEVGLYYVGTSSQPTIVIDDQNRIFVIWAGITETFNNGLQDYRHLWGRASIDGGATWEAKFVDLTADLSHIFDECVFPNVSQTSDDFLYLNYQLDQEPGLSVRGDEDDPAENKIQFMKVDKNDFIVGIKDTPAIRDIDVAQNQPNPFNGTSTVYVNLNKGANLSLDVTNMMGQVVYSIDAGQASAGLNKLEIDGSQLSSGVYFYTVTAGKSVVTKKMIVE